jgi:hypothetical protein
MRFERIFKLKISADSLALPKEILSQKGAKDHRLKNWALDGGGYNFSEWQMSIRRRI